jgi:D-sedoheptulose 7-phosphate isomerase
VNPADLLTRACDETRHLLPAVEALAPRLEQACTLLGTCWTTGGKVLTCGNGGSCADAMHLAEELTVRFQHDRRPLAAIALADPSAITCCGNDLGYDHVFARQVQALARPEDVLVVFSTSGNSPNILLAIERARDIGCRTLAFLGKDGGRAKGRCDVELIVPAGTAHRVQEGHKLLFHTICEWADAFATESSNA